MSDDPYKAPEQEGTGQPRPAIGLIVWAAVCLQGVVMIYVAFAEYDAATSAFPVYGFLGGFLFIVGVWQLLQKRQLSK